MNNYKKKDSVLRWFSVAWYVASIPGIIQEIMIQTILPLTLKNIFITLEFECVVIDYKVSK